MLTLMFVCIHLAETRDFQVEPRVRDRVGVQPVPRCKNRSVAKTTIATDRDPGGLIICNCLTQRMCQNPQPTRSCSPAILLFYFRIKTSLPYHRLAIETQTPVFIFLTNCLFQTRRLLCDVFYALSQAKLGGKFKLLAHKPACVFYWSIPVFSIIIFPLPNFAFHVVIVKVARIKKEKGGIFILSRLFPPLSLPVLRLPCWLHVHGMTYFCFKVWLNGQQKRATCFATYCSNTC